MNLTEWLPAGRPMRRSSAPDQKQRRRERTSIPPFLLLVLILTLAPATYIECTAGEQVGGDVPADECASNAEKAVTPQERGEYGLGDMIMTSVRMPVFRVLNSSEGGNASHYAPQWSTLWIDSEVSIGGQRAWVVHFRCIGSEKRGWLRCLEGADHRQFEGAQVVEKYRSYWVLESDLMKYAPRTFGFEYGALVVPYKFHLDDNALTGEASVGAYVGYRLASPGLAITPVLSVGFGAASTRGDTNAGEDADPEDNALSLTLALGTVTTLTRQGRFQLGFLFGWDWTGDDSDYQYEGEPWLALSFGTKLTD